MSFTLSLDWLRKGERGETDTETERGRKTDTQIDRQKDREIKRKIERTSLYMNVRLVISFLHNF